MSLARLLQMFMAPWRRLGGTTCARARGPWRDEDDLSAARGLITAGLIGAALWGLALLAWRALRWGVTG